MARKLKLDAKNTDGTRDLFNKRKDYDNYAVETGLVGGVPFESEGPKLLEHGSIIDLEKSKRYLLGKTTSDQHAILPKPDKIVSLKYVQETKTVRAFDFVQESFDAMARRYDELLRANRIVVTSNTDTAIAPLDSIRAAKGYSSSLNTYTQQSRAYYRQTVLTMPQKTKEQIRNLKDFVDVYVDMLLGAQGNPPYFLSDYLKSGLNSPITTGLTVEIASGPYDDDQYKVDNFLKSPNFRKYTGITQEFGFIIDKQIPWRLVADFNSKAMKSVISRLDANSIGSHNTIEAYYSLIDYDDFVIMLNNIYTAYSFFIKNNPFTKIGDMKQTILKRSPIQIMQLSQIPQDRWIEIYIRLKNKYSGVLMNDIELNRIITAEKQKVDILKLPEIVTSINRKFNFTPYDSGSSTYKNLKLKSRQSPRMTKPLQEIKDFYIAKLMNQY